MKLVLSCLLLVIAGVFVSCAIAPAAPACSTPSTLTISYTWAPSAQVGVVNTGVPSTGVSQALSNWNAGLLAYCYSPTLYNGSFGSAQINMRYGPIPPPSNCPSGSTCYTRGITDLPNATFNGGRLAGVNITINSAVTDTAAITEVVAHEFGHTFGLVDCNYPSCPTGSSVMEAGAPTNSINGLIGQPGPTSCDINAVGSVATDYKCPPPPPPPHCCKCPTPPTAKGEQTYNRFFLRKVQTDGCQTGYSTACCGSTPVIIDTSGNGFVLTSAANGVKFDISGAGIPVQISWTAPGSGNAFLCLPDANGACDDGKDLFGSFTPQPPSSTPNGFAALAVYDQPANGGNGDGIIDSRDAIFSSLRLWIDANQDGISQPNELFTLPSLGVHSISLNYMLDSRTDQYGNIFRYRAQVNPGGAPGTGRMAYDVFLTIQSGGNTITAQSCPAVQRPPILQGKDGRTGTLK